MGRHMLISCIVVCLLTKFIDHLWAISGSINVDPKHFRSKLNREGFVGDELHSELNPSFANGTQRF